ncbi:acyl-CoA thioesterase [Treponema sp.]|uniref:acyl-CoA thioesterase n=1 Tax=Treponema sp. TaxID=166 RepID=UPI00298DFB6E|nr:acyl-CoA thioesterase [Treponema sp.]MCQ2241371.1 acyl-CoA thioesterase [Treponema sp.]
MDKEYYSVEKEFKVEFYDVDSMDIAYHGNYVRFMEIGRCALLDEIGYNYIAMKEEGYSFPVVDIKVRYLKSLHFNEVAKIRSSVTEYENCLKVKYEIYNSKGELTTKAESTQMVINKETGETMFVCPETLIEKMKSAMERQKMEK